ncbi:MAG: bifunctional phosphopantothenoylcysteine decarboxylase/phosphopantothenate--cysteine ligase CoaBC [Desulfofustis sp.]|nr:bifunctional phosphopantothenoylcysteine decarboxylase/phosphopantothenate--cysteine ligase CoaBC [Desulfofustis sp.]
MSTSFAGKRIVVGVTGSIAAFKVAGWVSTLSKEEALVDVIMTASARRFVTPLTFASLSGRRVYGDMFADELSGSISHIGLAREADCILVAPATAQTIARLAHGHADDLLSTTILAATVPVIVCPAMNVKMFEHPATQKNLGLLRELGYRVIEPESGVMACGEQGSGRLPEWEVVAEQLLRTLAHQDLAGQVVLVTAGPTREPFDPARFLSNRSSGKMGYAIARSAFRRGAEVILISGPTTQAPPAGVRVINVTTARQMHEAVMSHYREASVIVKAAAVSDFRSAEEHREKIKKDRCSLVLHLEPNPDILKELGECCDHRRQLLVGFAAESSDFEQEGRKKLTKKKLDLIAVNDISTDHSGFAVDGNRLILIDGNGVTKLPHTSKIRSADLLWDHIVNNGLLK